MIYVIRADSELLWYHHDGRANGTFAWHGPTPVGDGWNFKQVLSGGAAPAN